MRCSTRLGRADSICRRKATGLRSSATPSDTPADSDARAAYADFSPSVNGQNYLAQHIVRHSLTSVPVYAARPLILTPIAYWRAEPPADNEGRSRPVIRVGCQGWRWLWRELDR